MTLLNFFIFFKLSSYSWTANILNIVMDSLGGIRKGWMNLNEKNHDIYVMGKLSKFMKVLKYMMQDTLRGLALSSLDSLYSLFVKHSPGKVEIHGTDKIVLEKQVLVCSVVRFMNNS
jgi:hypothetical protein